MFGQFLGFLGLVAGFVFAMGLVTNYRGTVAIINSSSHGLVDLLTLELGVVPHSGGQPYPVKGVQ